MIVARQLDAPQLVDWLDGVYWKISWVFMIQSKKPVNQPEKNKPMLHLTLRQLEIFCAVAQNGSTVAAAEVVSLSQSATSAALQQLEQGLGAALFERVGKRLALNDAGRAMLPQALALLE